MSQHLCYVVQSSSSHSLSHFIVVILKKTMYSTIKIKCVLDTEQIKLLLEDLTILACIWLLNRCSETFQL